MTLTLSKFADFQKAQRATRDAQEWMSHIGARGRGNDVLAISIAHCSIQLTIAGQYTDGGKNYWESPSELNAAILRVICKRRDEILSDAIGLMKADVDAKLVAAKDEIAAVNAAIEQAAA